MILEYIKKYERKSIFVSALIVIFSLFLIFKPETTLNLFVTLFGILLLLDGIWQLYVYFKNNRQGVIMNMKLVKGVIIAIIGIFTLFNTKVIISILPLVIGAWIIIKSLLKLQLVSELRKTNAPNWKLLLIYSIITIVLGIIIVLNPFDTAVAITVMAGIFLLISELADLFGSVYIIKQIK